MSTVADKPKQSKSAEYRLRIVMKFNIETDFLLNDLRNAVSNSYLLALISPSFNFAVSNVNPWYTSAIYANSGVKPLPPHLIEQLKNSDKDNYWRELHRLENRLNAQARRIGRQLYEYDMLATICCGLIASATRSTVRKAIYESDAANQLADFIGVSRDKVSLCLVTVSYDAICGRKVLAQVP